MSWRLAGSLQTLSSEVRARWPGTTIWTIGDAAHRSRASDHNPNAAGVVVAVDVVGRAVAQATVDHVVARRDPRVKYIIFRSRIMSGRDGTQPWVWRTYTGSNPHSNHAHISVGRGRDGRSTRADLYDDRGAWGLANVTSTASGRGSTEDAIVEAVVTGIQEELNRAGHRDQDGRVLVVDGAWGARTQRAFRRALAASGGVGPRGARGATGARGVQGVPGVRGARGPVGAPGKTPTKVTVSLDAAVVASE